MARGKRAEELERINRNTAKATGKGSPAATAPQATPDAPDAPDKLNFDDAKTQELILNPEGREVDLPTYGKLRLYPPAMMVRRMAMGFASEVYADVGASRPENAAIFALRLISVLTSTPTTQLRLLRLTAYMCGKPGEVDDETAGKLQAELSDRCDSDDLSILFVELCKAAGVKDIQEAAKNHPSRSR